MYCEDAKRNGKNECVVIKYLQLSGLYALHCDIQHRKPIALIIDFMTNNHSKLTAMRLASNISMCAQRLTLTIPPDRLKLFASAEFFFFTEANQYFRQ